MRHNVTLVDPAGYKYAYLLTDACRYVAAGLRGLGHATDLTVNQIEVPGRNVVVGTHLLTGQEAASIAQSGAEYVALHSEWLFTRPDGTGVVSSFVGDRLEREYGRFYQRAAAVWDPYQWNLDLLARLGIAPEKLRLIPTLGYATEIDEIAQRPWAEKDIDVLFFGSITPRRNRVLDALGRSCKVVSVLDAPKDFRNDLIARARLNLNLPGEERYTHLSVYRVAYLLNNRGALISEAATTHADLQAMIETAPYDRLIEACLEALPRAEEIAERGYAAFKETSMAEVMRPVVEPAAA
jgi:hypothetical protein